MTKKKERNQKGFWKNRRMTHKVKVNKDQLQSRTNPQEEVKVKKKVIPDEVISVLFVPHTPHSELAKMLRKDEQAISKLSRCCIKRYLEPGLEISSKTREWQRILSPMQG